jgi:hypothetical protein
MISYKSLSLQFQNVQNTRTIPYSYYTILVPYHTRTIPYLSVQPSTWRWTLGFETCRRHHKIWKLNYESNKMHFVGLYRIITSQCKNHKNQLMHSLNWTCRNYSGTISLLTMITMYGYSEWPETVYVDNRWIWNMLLGSAVSGCSVRAVYCVLQRDKPHSVMQRPCRLVLVPSELPGSHHWICLDTCSNMV